MGPSGDRGHRFPRQSLISSRIKRLAALHPERGDCIDCVFLFLFLRYAASQRDILRAIYCYAMRYDMEPVIFTCRRHISHRRYIALFCISRLRRGCKIAYRGADRLHIAVALKARQNPPAPPQTSVRSRWRCGGPWNWFRGNGARRSGPWRCPDRAGAVLR